MDANIPNQPVENVNTTQFQVRMEHDESPNNWQTITGASTAHEAAEVFVCGQAQVDPAVLHGVAVRVKGIGLFRVFATIQAVREN